MNTKWNMAIFLFLGFISAVLLISSIMRDDNKQTRPAKALLSSVFAVAALTVIVIGLNNPAKIVTILSTPKKGFSGAVIMQAITVITGIFVFFQLRKRYGVARITAALVSIASVFALSKIYMISTRPALNSYLVSVMLILLLAQSATLLSLKSSTSVRSTTSALAICTLYGLSFIVFAIRLSMLTPPDRILDFTRVVSGSLSPLFWGIMLCTIVVPLAYILFARAKKNFNMAWLAVSANTAGIFLMCMLICQMPFIERGINNRVFL